LIGLGLKAYFEILRPINCFFGSLTVFIGIINAYNSDVSLFFLNPKHILLLTGGILIFFLISGASNTINDIFDLEIDRINRPTRPIPRGAIKKSHALRYYVILVILAVLLSILTGSISVNFILIPLLTTFFAFTGFFYAWKGKALGLPGNIIVGVSYSFGIPFGSLFISQIQYIPAKIWFFFFTSMFLLISREIIKGMEDIEGDRKFKIKTVANTMGFKASAFFSTFFSVLAILTFTIPVFILKMSIYFAIFMIIGNIVVILSCVFLLIDLNNKKHQKKSSLLLKIGAFCGLMAYALALV
jgi:geranylgeranylglycerol-phosphate geranylgeranyltransferase